MSNPTAPSSSGAEPLPPAPADALPTKGDGPNGETFKNVAAGVQSIVIAISLIVGGTWTLYTFSSLHVREKAETDLQGQRASLLNQQASELRAAEAARRLALTDLTMRVEPMPLPDRPFLQRVTVSIKNNGTRTLKLIHDKDAKGNSALPPLVVYSVGFKEEPPFKSPAVTPDPYAYRSQNVFLSERRRYPLITLDADPPTYSFIEPLETYDYPFLVDTERPGVFWAAFHALVDQVQRDDYMRDAKVESGYVQIRDFFTVPPPKTATPPTTAPSAKP